MLVLTLAAEPLQVQWSAPASCPSVETVQQAIEANLAREEFADTLDAVTIEATVQENPTGWQLDVQVRLPEGAVERRLTAATCAELADAAGLIIAVALDPLRVQQVRPEPEPTPEGLPEAWANPPQPPPPEEPEAAPPPPDKEPRTGVELRLTGTAGFGALPRVRGGASLGAGLVRPWMRADVSLLYWAPRAFRPFDEPTAAGARVQQAGVGARACLKPQLGAWEPSTCGGLEGGVAWATGVGLDAASTTTLPWLTATTGLELAWMSRAQVGVFAGVDAQFNAIRPRVRVDGLGEVVEIAPIGVRALAGLSLRIAR